MAEPYADAAHYIANFGAPPSRIADRLDQELARASRYVRAELPGLDERIDAYKPYEPADPDTVDPDLVADIVCEMVAAAAASPAGLGVASMSDTTGPFSQSQTFSNPMGDLFLSKKHRRLLGGGTQQAFTIPMRPPLPPLEPWQVVP